jgi:hypothetical protein
MKLAAIGVSTVIFPEKDSRFFTNHDYKTG